MNHDWGDTRAQWPRALDISVKIEHGGSIPGQSRRFHGDLFYLSNITNFRVFLIRLKTEVPCIGSYPQACKRSQTVWWKI